MFIVTLAQYEGSETLTLWDIESPATYDQAQVYVLGMEALGCTVEVEVL